MENHPNVWKMNMGITDGYSIFPNSRSSSTSNKVMKKTSVGFPCESSSMALSAMVLADVCGWGSCLIASRNLASGLLSSDVRLWFCFKNDLQAVFWRLDSQTIPCWPNFHSLNCSPNVHQRKTVVAALSRLKQIPLVVIGHIFLVSYTPIFS